MHSLLLFNLRASGSSPVLFDLACILRSQETDTAECTARPATRSRVSRIGQVAPRMAAWPETKRKEPELPMAMSSTSSESYQTLLLSATSQLASRLYAPSALVNATAFWPQPTPPLCAQFAQVLAQSSSCCFLSVRQTLFPEVSMLTDDLIWGFQDFMDKERGTKQTGSLSAKWTWYTMVCPIQFYSTSAKWTGTRIIVLSCR
jgi:hypothetical protein